MNINFKYNEAEKAEPVRIEQVFAEKPGGGMVSNPTFDVPPTTAVGENDGVLVPIGAYRLVAAVAVNDTTIKIEKGSNVAVGTAIGHGSKAVAVTAVSKTNADYDLVTVTLGVGISKGEVLYEAAEASQNAAEPVITPQYVTGNYIYANEGDQPVRLINGANLRKETANIAPEVAKLMVGIHLV